MAMDLFEKGNLNEKLRYAFQLYDFDCNGVLTRSEIIRMIKMIISLRDETANEHLRSSIISHLNTFFKYFDVNHDRKISLNEFCTICEQDELIVN
jgi:Ca2+-binding EF-hand superfamily protein